VTVVSPIGSTELFGSFCVVGILIIFIIILMISLKAYRYKDKFIGRFLGNFLVAVIIFGLVFFTLWYFSVNWYLIRWNEVSFMIVICLIALNFALWPIYIYHYKQIKSLKPWQLHVSDSETFDDEENIF
jgi:hypothetical protein